MELANMDTLSVYVELITCEESRCAMTGGTDSYRVLSTCRAKCGSLLMTIPRFLL
jgi:hypothetical protein